MSQRITVPEEETLSGQVAQLAGQRRDERIHTAGEPSAQLVLEVGARAQIAHCGEFVATWAIEQRRCDLVVNVGRCHPACRGSLPGGGSLWAGWPTLC